MRPVNPLALSRCHRRVRRVHGGRHGVPAAPYFVVERDRHPARPARRHEIAQETIDRVLLHDAPVAVGQQVVFQGCEFQV